MAVTPLVFVERIKFKLENSTDETVKSIKPLLSAYKGAEIQFKEKEKGLTTEFTIGMGVNIKNASIFIIPNSDKTTNVILEVTATDSLSIQEDPEKITKKIDILIKDILENITPRLKIKEKAKLIEKGKICPDCKTYNDIDGKFCKKCGFIFSEISSMSPKIPHKPSNTPKMNSRKEKKPQSISYLSNKYPKQYECELCEAKCAYKDPFILLLSDLRNLEEPFNNFNGFLRTKDFMMFTDYVYEYAREQMKKYPKFSIGELSNIAFCIFSILSFHILEKATKQIRLIFAKKVKEQINARFNREHTSVSDGILIETDAKAPIPTIKTGKLHIEENRCPYCYKKFDKKTLKLKIKGYMVNCPNCDELL